MTTLDGMIIQQKRIVGHKYRNCKIREGIIQTTFDHEMQVMIARERPMQVVEVTLVSENTFRCCCCGGSKEWIIVMVMN